MIIVNDNATTKKKRVSLNFHKIKKMLSSFRVNQTVNLHFFIIFYIAS